MYCKYTFSGNLTKKKKNQTNSYSKKYSFFLKAFKENFLYFRKKSYFKSKNVDIYNQRRTS